MARVIAGIAAWSVLLLSSVAPTAQTSEAMLTGRVIDRSGEVLPGAAIGIAGPGTYTLVSGADGGFHLTGIPPGRYTITVGLPGFRTEVRERLLRAGTTALEIRMRIGCLENPLSVVEPLADVMRKADAVFYGVVTQVGAPRNVVLGDVCYRASIATLNVFQALDMPGKVATQTEVTLVVQRTATVGDEFIVPATWHAAAQTFEAVPGHMMLVEAGRVRLNQDAGVGLLNDMDVTDVFSVLERLAASR